MAEPFRKSEPRKEVCDLALDLLEAMSALARYNDEIKHASKVLKETKKPNAKVDFEDAKKIAEKRLHLAQVEVDRVKSQMLLFKDEFSPEVQMVFDGLDANPEKTARALLDLLGKK